MRRLRRFLVGAHSNRRAFGRAVFAVIVVLGCALPATLQAGCGSATDTKGSVETRVSVDAGTSSASIEVKATNDWVRIAVFLTRPGGDRVEIGSGNCSTAGATLDTGKLPPGDYSYSVYAKPQVPGDPGGLMDSDIVPANLAATGTFTIPENAVESVIQGYFTHYYKSLERLGVDQAIYDYVADTDETHLYLCQLQYEIDWRTTSGAGGIADSRVQSVQVQHADPQEDGSIDVSAYVEIRFRYLDDESGTMTGPGGTWYLTCATTGGKLKIVALDNVSSDYLLAKELTEANLREHAGDESYTKKDAIDDAYAVINTTDR